MSDIRTSQDILLHDGYNEFVIDSQRDLDLTFRATQDSDVFIRVLNSGKLRIRTFTSNDVNVSYLFWNQTNQLLEVDESHDVFGNANLTVAYGELNNSDTTRKTYVALLEEGATATVSSASLVNNKKTYNIDVVNFAPHTFGNMKNYAVVLENGKLMIDAIGKIVKGAKGSESHQTSRALSFAKGQSTTILPELLIDENDVQASHAMSIGTADEEQLYYMRSRGLTIEQCIALIATGYLMPIVDTLTNEELKTALQNEMERKIGELC